MRKKLFSLFAIMATVAVTLMVGCVFQEPEDGQPGQDVVMDQGMDQGKPDEGIQSDIQKEAVEDVQPEAEPDIIPDTEPDTQPDVQPDICVPNCQGKACGDDGCGGSCGICLAPACVLASCSAESKCVFTPVECNNDEDVCTTDSCNPATGICEYKPVLGCCKQSADCDDKDVCTADSCEAGVCKNISKSCDDGEVCTSDSCDKELGCQNPVVDCNDGEVFTLDFCQIGVGCVHIFIGECKSDKECDDDNPCTDDDCEAGKCQYVTNTDSCDDNNPCTESDACAGGVCSGVQIKCEDDNECTTDSCGVKGCIFTPVTCDDGEICTTDLCDPLKGCTTTPKDCDDGNSCTDDSCEVGKGCQNVPLTTGGCCAEDNDCSSEQFCSNYICVAKTPCKTAADCDDKDKYTEDICDPVKGCVHYAFEFAFQCKSMFKQNYPNCSCEVWISYGGYIQGKPVGLYVSKKSGEKLVSNEICNSWWVNVDDPAGKIDSAQVELNARAVCSDSTEWIGGEYVEMVDPEGKLVALYVLHQSAKGVGWQDANGVWHNQNYGTQSGIPWCLK